MTGLHQLSFEVRAVEQVHLRQWRLDARTRGANACDALSGARLRLSWYSRGKTDAGAVPRVGEVWQAMVQLREPSGSANPGGFDYRLWLLGQGYAATGWIRSGNAYPGQTAMGYTIPAASVLSAYIHGGLLRALVVGDRAGVADHEWQLLRSTGTVHLLVVSGLHVGVAAAFLYGLTFAALRLLPGRWCRAPPGTVATLTSVAGVWLMVYLTGAGAPVLRAGIMASIVAATLLLRRRMGWGRCLALTAWVALLVQPRMIVQQGFWLSYAAVFSLLWVFGGRWRRLSWLSGMVFCQWVMFFAMPPWLTQSVGEFPIISPLANLLSVPIVSLVTLPLALSGWVLSGFEPGLAFAQWLLRGADFSLQLVLAVLTTVQDLTPQFGYSGASRAVMAFAGFLGLMLPLAGPFRAIALLAWSALLVPNPNRVELGQFRVVVLDVGQGSSAIVDTHSRRLVVDTGATFPSGFNVGQAIVVPALSKTGPARVDAILISHLDNDHAGGLPPIRRRWPAAELLRCDQRRRWAWDGVNFQLLQDPRGGSRNDRSCTLLVSNGAASSYFSGDVGHASERRLLPYLPKRLSLLIAPHHGSRNSSSPPFVAQLAPTHVVFSTGIANRYGHPHASVLSRYRDAGSQTWNTAETGALIWHSASPAVMQPTR